MIFYFIWHDNVMNKLPIRFPFIDPPCLTSMGFVLSKICQCHQCVTGGGLTIGTPIYNKVTGAGVGFKFLKNRFPTWLTKICTCSA